LLTAPFLPPTVVVMDVPCHLNQRGQRMLITQVPMWILSDVDPHLLGVVLSHITPTAIPERQAANDLGVMRTDEDPKLRTGLLTELLTAHETPVSDATIQHDRQRPR
jgi:hypothetical protein